MIKLKKRINSGKTIFDSLLFDRFLNKITFHNHKLKFLNKLIFIIQDLKKKFFKPNIFFFLILAKLRPIFKVYKKILHKKHKKSKKAQLFFKLEYFPRIITILNGYKKAVH